MSVNLIKNRIDYYILMIGKNINRKNKKYVRRRQIIVDFCGGGRDNIMDKLIDK